MTLVTPEEFRSRFPALERWAWLDTPGSPLGIDSVTETLRNALDDGPSPRPLEDGRRLCSRPWLQVAPVPRGAAWLYVAPHLLERMRPVQPSWKSTSPPFGYFGIPSNLPASAHRLDTSPAWLAWIGSIPALEAVATLDALSVEQHCVRLAVEWRDAAIRLGFDPVLPKQESHRCGEAGLGRRPEIARLHV